MRKTGRGRLVPILLVLACSGGLLMLACSGSATPADARGNDGTVSSAPSGSLGLCAPFHMRADRRLAGCVLDTPPETLAAMGGVLGVGTFWDVSEPRQGIPATHPCDGIYGHPRNAAFIRRVRAAREPDGPPLRFVHLGRFELVPVSFAALPGFESRFLLRTRRPFSAVRDFFEKDRSPACGSGGCGWSDSLLGEPGDQPGRRLRDLIDRHGGPGTHRQVVYYLSRAREGRRRFWPRAAIADLREPDYRAWRVAEAKRALAIGGYDAVMLNHKFPQLRDPAGFWIDAPGRKSVAAINRGGDTLWSAPPEGYGFTEYVQGWAALGRDLRAAGVPYAMMLTAGAWAGRGYDDRSTADVDEGALIQKTASGASILVLLSSADAQAAARVAAAIGPDTELVLARPEPGACPDRNADQAPDAGSASGFGP